MDSWASPLSMGPVHSGCSPIPSTLALWFLPVLHKGANANLGTTLPQCMLPPDCNHGFQALPLGQPLASSRQGLVTLCQGSASLRTLQQLKR